VRGRKKKGAPVRDIDKRVSPMLTYYKTCRISSSLASYNPPRHDQFHVYRKRAKELGAH
jgi:hypothetical protein